MHAVYGLGYGGSSTNWRALVSGLRSEDDSTSLQSATELSELLLMSAEDNFSGFPYSEFLAACAELLHREHNPELMVWSARCLTNVVEAMPRAAGYIAQNSGLIAELCAKLMNIEYMELAEQSLLALQIIAKEQPGAVVRANGISAVLSFLEFFPASIQFTALQTAVTLSRRITSDQLDALIAIMPGLLSILARRDERLLPPTISFLFHSAEALKPEALKRLGQSGVCQAIAQLLSAAISSPSNGSSSAAVQSQSLKILALLAGASSELTIELVQTRFHHTLSALHRNATGDFSSVVLNVACDMLPLVVIPSGTPSSDSDVKSTAIAAMSTSSSSQIQTSQQKIEHFRANAEEYIDFGQHLLTLFLGICQSNSDALIRLKCLQGLYRMLHWCDQSVLQPMLREHAVCAFIMKLLQSSGASSTASPAARSPRPQNGDISIRTARTALHLASVLMQRLPDIYRDVFFREGALPAIRELSNSATEVPALDLDNAATATPSKLQSTQSAPPSRQMIIENQEPEDLVSNSEADHDEDDDQDADEDEGEDDDDDDDDEGHRAESPGDMFGHHDVLAFLGIRREHPSESKPSLLGSSTAEESQRELGQQARDFLTRFFPAALQRPSRTSIGAASPARPTTSSIAAAIPAGPPPTHTSAPVFDTSLSQHSELDDFATESTRKLHALGLQLKAISSQQLDRPVQEQEIAEWMRILSETRDTLMGSANDTGITTFEFLNSGIVLALVHFLSVDASNDEQPLQYCHWRVRQRLFANVFFGLPLPDSVVFPLLRHAEQQAAQRKSAAMEVPSSGPTQLLELLQKSQNHCNGGALLVKKLLDALSSVERLPSLLNEVPVPSSRNTSTPADIGIQLLSFPLRLNIRFGGAKNEADLPEYIQPLTDMSLSQPRHYTKAFSNKPLDSYFDHLEFEMSSCMIDGLVPLSRLRQDFSKSMRLSSEFLSKLKRDAAPAPSTEDAAAGQANKKRVSARQKKKTKQDPQPTESVAARSTGATSSAPAAELCPINIDHVRTAIELASPLRLVFYLYGHRISDSPDPTIFELIQRYSPHGLLNRSSSESNSMRIWESSHSFMVYAVRSEVRVQEVKPVAVAEPALKINIVEVDEAPAARVGGKRKQAASKSASIAVKSTRSKSVAISSPVDFHPMEPADTEDESEWRVRVRAKRGAQTTPSSSAAESAAAVTASESDSSSSSSSPTLIKLPLLVSSLGGASAVFGASEHQYQRFGGKLLKSAQRPFGPLPAAGIVPPAHVSQLEDFFEHTDNSMPVDQPQPDSMWPMLILLRMLHHLRDDVALLYPSLAYRTDMLSIEDDQFKAAAATHNLLWSASTWHCDRISHRVRQHLEDPLTVAARLLPDWLHWIMLHCQFLIPLQLRQLYVRVSAFGTVRAIESLENHLLAAGLLTPAAQRQPLTDLGMFSSFIYRMQQRPVTAIKVPVAKIVVQREFALTHAASAVEAVNGRDVTWRVEFHGEAGIGLGPTLEYFTLLSHEIQRSDLGLWMDDSNQKLHSAPSLQHEMPHEVEADHVVASELAELQDESAPVRSHRAPAMPAAPVKCTDMHRFCVVRCPSCCTTTIPSCSTHNQLLTAIEISGTDQEFVWRCAVSGCATSISNPIQSRCEQCDRAVEVLEWAASNEEAAFLRDCYPAGLGAISLPVLTCPRCRSVNFPGVGKRLLCYVGGQMLSMPASDESHPIHPTLPSPESAQDFRASTRHLRQQCRGGELDILPVVLTKRQVNLFCNLILQSPIVAIAHGQSANLQPPKRRLHLPSVETKQYVQHSHGIFPSVHVGAAVSADRLRWYELVGSVLAQSLADARLLDAPINRSLCTVLAGRSLTLSDTLLLNTPVGKVLLRLQQCQDTIVEIRAHRHPSKRQPFEFTDQELACLSIDGCNLSDLSLDFTVPGFSDVRLPESNSDTDVVFSNLSTYIDSVGSFFTVNACREPVAALRRGMTRGMGDTAALLALSESESESILCGDHDRAWDLSVPTLVRHARCQGFENSDRIVMALFECIAKFTPVQQRQFIRFVTGSPRLPLGGLKNLNPGLTIVRDNSMPHGTEDMYLPTAKTCTSYLKLPAYSSVEVLEQKLLYSMHEGQSTFQLS